MPSLYDVFAGCAVDKNLDKIAIDDLEMRLKRDRKTKPSAATILSMVETTPLKEWVKDKDEFNNLLKLVAEFDAEAPVLNSFEPPADAYEVNDSPDMEEDTEDAVPTKEVQAPIQPTLAIKPTTGAWNDLKNHTVAVVIYKKGSKQVVDETDIATFLDKTGLVDTITKENVALNSKLLEASDTIKRLSEAVKSKKAVDTSRKQTVQLHTDLGDLIYTPVSVVATERAFVMYFHSSTPPSFIPRISDKQFTATILGNKETYKLQYVGMYYQDALNPEFNILGFSRL